MEIKTVKIIDVYEWDKLVSETYGRPYSFQQQDGCKSRGTFKFTAPEEIEDYENDTVPEIVNHDDMGVSFTAWLKRDPETLLINNDKKEGYNMAKFSLSIWWERNFYPEVQMVINDLCKRGLLEAGEYTIDIDW